MNTTTARAERKFAATIATVTVALILGLTCSAEARGAAAIAKDLKTPAAGATADVIVQFSTGPSDAAIAAIERSGARTKARFKHVPAGVFSVAASALKTIA